MTINANTGVGFKLSEDEFRQDEEQNAMMKIRIAKDGALANPVHLKITPLTVIEAERLKIVNFTRPADDEVSPSVAGKVHKVTYVLENLFLHRYE